jgi:hypothetical protein
MGEGEKSTSPQRIRHVAAQRRHGRHPTSLRWAAKKRQCVYASAGRHDRLAEEVDALWPRAASLITLQAP